MTILKNKITKEQLYDLYWNKELPTVKIGKIFQCSGRWIRYLLDNYSILRRNPSEAKNLSKKLGKEAPNYKGGLPKCIDCGRELTYYRKNIRCKECRFKFAIGKNASRYIDGRSLKTYFCIDCNKEVCCETAINGQGRCQKCSGAFYSGVNSFNYDGGELDLIHQIRDSWKGQEWRKKALKRDGKKCQICNLTENLGVHHKIPLRYILDLYQIIDYAQAKKCNLFWDINWGITLCMDCHKTLGNI